MGAGDIFGAGRNDPAEEILFKNDLAVVVSVCSRGNEGKKFGDSYGSADLVKHVPVFKRLGERDQIDRFPTISHLH